jgi:hypothetical protein
MGRTCSRHISNAYTYSVGKPERKRTLERCRCRWEDNIKMDIREIVCGFNFPRIGSSGGLL